MNNWIWLFFFATHPAFYPPSALVSAAAVIMSQCPSDQIHQMRYCDEDALMLFELMVVVTARVVNNFSSHRETFSRGSVVGRNVQQIGSAVLHGSPVCPTHRHTDYGTCDICSNRPHLLDACDAIYVSDRS